MAASPLASRARHPATAAGVMQLQGQYSGTLLAALQLSLPKQCLYRAYRKQELEKTTAC